MGVKKNGLGTKNEYTVTYSGMRGVDFGACADSDRGRFAYLENMYRDYDATGGVCTESIPGYRSLAHLSGRINSMIMQKTSNGESVFSCTRARPFTDLRSMSETTLWTEKK